MRKDGGEKTPRKGNRVFHFGPPVRSGHSKIEARGTARPNNLFKNGNKLELGLILIQAHMIQIPLLRLEVGAFGVH